MENKQLWGKLGTLKVFISVIYYGRKLKWILCLLVGSVLLTKYSWRNEEKGKFKDWDKCLNKSLKVWNCHIPTPALKKITEKLKAKSTSSIEQKPIITPSETIDKKASETKKNTRKTKESVPFKSGAYNFLDHIVGEYWMLSDDPKYPKSRLVHPHTIQSHTTHLCHMIYDEQCEHQQRAGHTMCSAVML